MANYTLYLYLNFPSSFAYTCAGDLSAPRPSRTPCLVMLGLELSKPYFGFPSRLCIRLYERGILDGDYKAGEGRRNIFLAGRLLAVPKSFTLLYFFTPGAAAPFCSTSPKQLAILPAAAGLLHPSQRSRHSPARIPYAERFSGLRVFLSKLSIRELNLNSTGLFLQDSKSSSFQILLFCSSSSRGDSHLL